MNRAKGTPVTGDGDLDCESEMLEEFLSLVERALKAGWAEEEVANALLSLAQTHALNLEDAAVADAVMSRRLQ